MQYGEFEQNQDKYQNIANNPSIISHASDEKIRHAKASSTKNSSSNEC
jgi:hypothetical protein